MFSINSVSEDLYLVVECQFLAQILLYLCIGVLCISLCLLLLEMRVACCILRCLRPTLLAARRQQPGLKPILLAVLHQQPSLLSTCSTLSSRALQSHAAAAFDCALWRFVQNVSSCIKCLLECFIQFLNVINRRNRWQKEAPAVEVSDDDDDDDVYGCDS